MTTYLVNITKHASYTIQADTEKEASAIAENYIFANKDVETEIGVEEIYDMEEIKKALKVLCDVCGKYIVCNLCPLFDHEKEECYFNDFPYGIPEGL